MHDPAVNLAKGTVVHNKPDVALLDRCRAVCSHIDHYSFLGISVALRSDTPELLSAIRLFFAGFQADSSRQRCSESASFYLCYDSAHDRPYRVVSPAGRYVEASSWEPVFSFLLSMVHAHIWSSQRRVLPLHSAAVSYEGRGALIPATSGGGKTTLALELAIGGFDYLSDEFAPIDLGSLFVLPFPRPLQASAETIEMLLGTRGKRILAGASFLDDDGTERYLVPPVDWVSISEAAPVDYLIFPVLRGGQRARVEPLEKTEALAELSQLALVFHADMAWKQQAVEGLVAIVRRAECCRLFLGAIGTNRALIADLVTSARKGHAEVEQAAMAALDQVSLRARQLLDDMDL